MKTPSTKTWLIFFVAINIIGFWAFVIFSFFREAPASAKISDEAEILFGSATLVLTVLTIFLGILAVVGWYDVRNHALRVADEKIQDLRDKEVLPLAEKRLKEAEEQMAKWRKEAEERISMGIKEAEERFSEGFTARLS